MEEACEFVRELIGVFFFRGSCLEGVLWISARGEDIVDIGNNVFVYAEPAEVTCGNAWMALAEDAEVHDDT